MTDLFTDFCRAHISARRGNYSFRVYARHPRRSLLLFLLLGNKRLFPRIASRYNLNKHRSSTRAHLPRPFGGFTSRRLRTRVRFRCMREGLRGSNVSIGDVLIAGFAYYSPRSAGSRVEGQDERRRRLAVVGQRERWSRSRRRRRHRRFFLAVFGARFLPSLSWKLDCHLRQSLRLLACHRSTAAYIENDLSINCSPSLLIRQTFLTYLFFFYYKQNTSGKLIIMSSVFYEKLYNHVECDGLKLKSRMLI